MQTYIIKNQQSDLAKLIEELRDEAVIIKNNTGNNFLLMPFSSDKIQDIFLMLHKSYQELNSSNADKNTGEIKMTAKEFTTKWLGFMKDAEISQNDKEQYREFLNKKYQ